jgi:hypothetical protein
MCFACRITEARTEIHTYNFILYEPPEDNPVRVETYVGVEE